MTSTLEQRRTAYLALIDTMTTAVTQLLPADGEETASLRGQLARVRARLADPEFYLAVIGDFSSGKSTLINALLGYDLLKRSEQKTTSTALRLHYGAEKAFTLKLTTGETLKYPAQTRRIWRLLRQLDPALPRRGWWRDLFHPERVFVDLVQYIGADDTLRPHIARCDVAWPSDFLRNNVTIIDTPGLNALEEHQAITEGVLQDTADLAIVTMRAHFQLSRFTELFIAEQLGPFLPRCLFVVTIADKEPEMDLVMASLQRRLGQAGVKDDQLLETAALYALDRAMGRTLDAAQERWADAFVGARATIVTYLQANAESVIQSRIRQLLAAIDGELNEGLAAREAALAEQGERLREAALPQLQDFVDRERQQIERRLNFAALTLRTSTLIPTIEAARRQAQSDLEDRVYAARNEREIDALAQSDVSPTIQTRLWEVQQRIQQDTTLYTAVQQAHEEFRSSFEEVFSKVQALAGAMRISIQNIPNTSVSQASSATIYQGTFDTIWRHYSQQKDGFFKKWKRRAFQRDQQIADYHSNLIAEYDALVVEVFSKVQVDVTEAQETLVSEWKQEISRIGERYVAHYRQAYEQVRLQHERDLQAVQQERQRVHEMIARLREQFRQTLGADGLDDGFYGGADV